MTRRHRQWHFWIWLFLCVTLAGGLVAATRMATANQAAAVDVPEGQS